jgi:bacteriocin-like protein
MIPTEVPVAELTDTELDAVYGGLLNFGNAISQQNVAVPIGLAQGGGVLSPAAVAQVIGQANFSL